MALSLAAAFLATSVGGWLLRERLHAALERSFEYQLKDRIESLAAQLEAAGLVATRGNQLEQGDFGRIFSGWYWVMQRGQDTYRSRSSWDSTLHTDRAIDLRGDARLWTLADPTGRPLLGIRRHLVVDGESAQLHVFGPMEGTLQEWRRINRILLSTQLALLLTLVVLTVLVVRLGLAPLRRLQLQLERVQSGQTQSVGQGYGADLDPVAAAVDQVLKRNTKVVERAQHQAADLSHALKKPLAILGIEARKPSIPGPWLQTQVQAMSHTIDRHLARFASGAGSTDWVQAHSVVQRIIALMQNIHHPKALQWELDGVDIGGTDSAAVRWRGVASDLEEMLGNLLDNAGKWASQQVRVTLRQGDGGMVVTIEDDGPGLSPAQLALAAQRGRRFDEAITGHGLGLAIVGDIAQTYGGQLTLGSSALGGLQCILRLPTGH